jgi:hypothetical protein
MSDDNGRPYNPHTPNFNDGAGAGLGWKRQGGVMGQRFYNDGNGKILPVPTTFREQAALTIYVELFRYRNTHKLMPEDLCTEDQMATATVKATDALLKALDAKGEDK